MTTDRIKTADPAAARDQGSMILVQNVFQRLLSTEPGVSEVAPGIWSYKPDLAKECEYTSKTRMTCSLHEELTFSNGNPVTSADVKFSIERAIRLNVTGASASMFASLRKIETPDPLTVVFDLSRYDRQFGWALASPAASILDHTVYSPDEIQANTEPIVGTGPFKVTEFNDSRLVLARFDAYIGRTPAQLDSLQLLTQPDSATIEEAMNTGQVDMVSRGLSSAALSRLHSQIQNSPVGTTATGFNQLVVPDARVLQVYWNPASGHRINSGLRELISGTLQEDRTLASVVPPQIPGSRDSFPLGGRATAKPAWTRKIALTLGYDPAIPDGVDMANQLRRRLESTGAISVQLRPNDKAADLHLIDRKAWVPTALAWLHPYINNPLTTSEQAVNRAENKARTTEDPTELYRALGQLQGLAAGDKLLLPLEQRDEYVYIQQGAQITPTSFGPGWQLGLWGVSIR